MLRVFLFNGGERGIRTLGEFPLAGLANLCFRPLSHLSAEDDTNIHHFYYISNGFLLQTLEIIKKM